MPVSHFPPLRPFFAVALFALSVAHTRADNTAWELAARFDFNAAHQALDAEAKSIASASADSASPAPITPAAHELARAASLLGVQPRTTDNVRRALANVREIAARPGLDRESRVNALFLEARILDVHLEPRSIADVRSHYTALLTAFPEHPLATQAVVPLALSLLYDTPPAGENTAAITASSSHSARLAAAEALLSPSLPFTVERDLRYVLGQTRLRWSEDIPLAKKHLLRAAEIGFAQAQRQASLWITVGRLAEETSDRDLARRAYQSFLTLARRDTRATEIRARLTALENNATVPPQPTITEARR